MGMTRMVWGAADGSIGRKEPFGLVFQPGSKSNDGDLDLGYDFVIDFPDRLTSITTGLGVSFSPAGKKFLVGPGAGRMSASVIGMMGDYSKGKTFVVNGIYNAAVTG